MSGLHESFPGPREIRLDLPAAHSAGRMARQVVARFAEREGLVDDELSTLELVVSELLSNAVDHGGGEAAMEESDLKSDVRMTLSLAFRPDRWELRVCDQGGGDPDAMQPFLERDGLPDLSDDRGRGFFLLLDMLQDLRIVRSPDEKGLEVIAVRHVELGGA
ncbi:MAG: ATP-binding protein [Planctomycetes bacterium]|nr:ATP-binding protein [Planctomycetota bacterium]MCB9904464.1 ATP-binding protein [Planctomycetota bacterium]